MGSFAWRNTAVNRLEKFLQKLPGVRQGARCRGLGTTSATVRQITSQAAIKAAQAFQDLFHQGYQMQPVRLRYPKQIPTKGIICCIPSHAARDYSLSLAVPEFSMPGIRLNIVKAWEPRSVLENNTSLHRKMREQESGIKTEASSN